MSAKAKQRYLAALARQREKANWEKINDLICQFGRLIDRFADWEACYEAMRGTTDPYDYREDF